MKLKHLVLAVSMAATTSAAFGGDFTTLPSDKLQVGGKTPDFDFLYVEATSLSFLDPDVFSSISYNAKSTRTKLSDPPSEVTASGVLELIDHRVTRDFVVGGDPIGNLYDFVFRDTRDNKLVFGTRILLAVEEDQVPDWELNFVYRSGFTGFDVAAAWLVTDPTMDLRLYNAGRTSSESTTAAFSFDPDTVRMQTDLNSGAENNPWSGLFLLKTDATAWDVAEDAIGVRQMGEEGQLPISGYYAGFVPTAPVPEPSTYAMLLGGLGLLGVMARRRRNA